ncbi:NGG1 [Candida jiufengensis]|uniref:NGG1 n=1 Tax=Candida jiufengensis TaxID=497108 RepID=UPI002224F736|nr:NGG1 [Candida jiufengensis]KAI5955817.1 NGG1 [Candida jiufengensis]
MSDHGASTTLNDIIDELKLTYDSSIGVLDGDSIRNIPNVNTLLNLNKLFNNLWKQLNEIENTDDEILNKIAALTNKNDGKRRLEEEDENENEEESKDVKDEDNEPHKKRKLGEEINSKDDPVPPVQTGSYTQENDTRLKNPKSEYVEPQTLSAEAISALGLFSESNNGLETHGKEYLKKKYGVASYPENDLLNLLPGKIPNIDFSKNKPPTNQVQFTTFQSYIESYFRLFGNDDIKALNERNIIPPGFEKLGYDPDVSPFIIPKLGRFYSDVWTEEDPSLAAKLNTPAANSASSIDNYVARGSINSLTDENLYTEDISCGPLSSRLLSAILSNHEGGGELEEKESLDDEVATQLNSGEDYKITTEVNDYQSIEDRLKRELKYIGIFMNLPINDDKKKRNPKISIIDNDEWIKNKEDDEVCAEIRALQKELREVVSRNRANKKQILPMIEDHIAYQEYSTILEDLDRQVDQAYIKRSKGKGKKKKIENNTPQQQAVNSGLRALLEKRKRWIDNIGNLFPPAEKMKRVPDDSIIIKQGEVENEEEEVVDEANDLFKQ